METLGELLPLIGFSILLIGIALIIIGAVLMAARRGSKRDSDKRNEGERNKRKFRAGGVVVVGPIPIIFGTDWKTIVIAVVAAIALIAIYAIVSSSWGLTY